MTDHILIGQPPEPDTEITECWALVATHTNGGEGVYGHRVQGAMQQFIATTPAMKDTMESFLRNRGVVEHARDEGITLEWRHLIVTGENEEIT
ncbi:MAG TPA: hypothetical protein VN903_03560 [Polyangia bacterium]|nr:hypothetical protein [Polyangia bacterium]